MEWNFDFNAKDKASAKTALGDKVPAAVATAIGSAIDALPTVAGAAVRVRSNGADGEDGSVGALVIDVRVLPLA